MAFPASPSDFTVELDLAGGWTSPTDITDKVYVRDAVDILRGRSAEGSIVDPSTMSLTLDNRTGRFSPRNPEGPYYGQLGRNTGIRASVIAGQVRAYSRVPGSGWFSTPDSAALSITGDLDVRADLRPASWRPGFSMPLVTKYDVAPNRSFYFELVDDGRLRLYWSQDGSALLNAVSTVQVPYPVTGRRAVRVTLDVNNGASGRTAAFYIADTIAGPWVQLGDPVVTAGTTSIFDSTTAVRAFCYSGDVYSAQVYQGIGGTLRANPIFTAQTEGTSVFADAQGNTWTANSSSVSVTARRYRFYGEVASWPQRWDPSGGDAWVPLTAAGVLRRLGQAGAGLRSTLYRGITRSATGLLAYWPLEDAAGSVTLAAGTDGARSIKIQGTPDLASYSDFKASAPVLQPAGAILTASVPPHTATGAFQVRFLAAFPGAGVLTDGTVLLRLYCGGTAGRWELLYGATFGGLLGLNSYNADNTNVSTSGYVAFNVHNKRVQVSIELEQNGANVDWRYSTINDDGTAAGYTSGTLVGYTIGKLQRVILNPGGAAMPEVAFGHLYAQSQVTNLNELTAQLKAFVGETVGARIRRLCAEEAIPLTMLGDYRDTEVMGPQSTAATLVELLSEAAETDQGILYEPRHTTGLAYRTRASLYSQTPRLALDYATAHLADLEPVDDDQELHNDITASRADGSSYRATLTTGALSILDPPGGVGRYEQSITTNPQTDAQLKHVAGWRLHLGTADEARYPTILVNLAGDAFAASPALTTDALSLDIGDRVTVTNLPVWLPPDDVSQLVRGSREVLGAFEHRVSVVGTPESPWRIGIFDDDDARYHSDGSTLAAGATSTATSLSVATATGPLWTTAAGDLPFEVVIAGERIRVTAVAGTTSPQTFTVTRSVNGVVKAQTSGAVVDLADPTYYAI